MKAFKITALLLAIAVAARGATIAELAQATPELSILNQALMATGLDAAVGDTTMELTVFAPTNEAFEMLISQLGVTAEGLLADPDTVTPILQNHVVPGVLFAADLTDGMMLQTLGGQPLYVRMADATVSIEPTGGPAGEVVTADIVADNGVVHIVNAVLLPGTEPVAPMMEETPVMEEEMPTMEPMP